MCLFHHTCASTDLPLNVTFLSHAADAVVAAASFPATYGFNCDLIYGISVCTQFPLLVVSYYVLLHRSDMF